MALRKHATRLMNRGPLLEFEACSKIILHSSLFYVRFVCFWLIFGSSAFVRSASCRSTCRTGGALFFGVGADPATSLRHYMYSCPVELRHMVAPRPQLESQHPCARHAKMKSRHGSWSAEKSGHEHRRKRPSLHQSLVVVDPHVRAAASLLPLLNVPHQFPADTAFRIAFVADRRNDLTFTRLRSMVRTCAADAISLFRIAMRAAAGGSRAGSRSRNSPRCPTPWGRSHTRRACVTRS